MSRLKVWNETTASWDYTGGGGALVLALEVVTKTAAYAITVDDDVVIADTTAGGFTVTLPTAVGATKSYTVKKSAAANTLTIDTAGGTIDGSATIPMTQRYLALTFVSDGTNWMII